MTALAEALLAAQRQALGALGKAYLAGVFATEDEAGPRELAATFEKMGCTDVIDRQQYLACLDVLHDYGGEAPKPTRQNGPKMPEPASDAQRNFIAKLCKERNVPEPDVIVSKDQAHEIIDALKAGTYNADAYTVPF